VGANSPHFSGKMAQTEKLFKISREFLLKFFFIAPPQKKNSGYATVAYAYQ